MKANNKEVASLPDNTKENQPVDRSRRSFAKAGVALGPVMMTLANRSAWGRDVNLCTQSGFASMQLVASQGVNFVAIPQSFDPPPPDEGSPLTEWQQWGTANGLTGAPFDTFTVEQWEAFAEQCYLDSSPNSNRRSPPEGRGGRGH